MNLRLPEQNQVLLTGNLTKDPEVRYTQKGTAMCRFRLGVNRRYKDPKTGEWKDDSTFVNVVVWREAAESCGKRLHKGSPVHVEGRLRSSEYEDKQTGQKRSTIEVEARRVQVLEKMEGAGNDAGSTSGGKAAAGDEAPADSSPDIEEVPF